MCVFMYCVLLVYLYAWVILMSRWLLDLLNELLPYHFYFFFIWDVLYRPHQPFFKVHSATFVATHFSSNFNPCTYFWQYFESFAVYLRQMLKLKVIYLANGRRELHESVGSNFPWLITRKIGDSIDSII